MRIRELNLARLNAYLEGKRLKPSLLDPVSRMISKQVKTSTKIWSDENNSPVSPWWLKFIPNKVKVNMAAIVSEEADASVDLNDLLYMPDYEFPHLLSEGREAVKLKGKNGEFLVMGSIAKTPRFGVFGALDPEKRLCAVKIPLPSCREKERAKVKLAKEAEILSGLSPHKGIVNYRGESAPRTTTFLATELIYGVNLVQALELLHSPSKALIEATPKNVVQEFYSKQQAIGPLSDKAKVAIREKLRRDILYATLDVADAICHLNEEGIVHRDVKPENILLDPDIGINVRPHGRLFDFDIGIPVGTEMVDNMAGTFLYMSPEQASGGGVYTSQIDVYNLAATIFHAVNGEPAIDFNHEKSILERLQKVSNFNAPKLWTKIDGLSPLIHTSMSRDPNERPTPQEFRDQLKVVLDNYYFPGV